MLSDDASAYLEDSPLCDQKYEMIYSHTAHKSCCHESSVNNLHYYLQPHHQLNLNRANRSNTHIQTHISICTSFLNEVLMNSHCMSERLEWLDVLFSFNAALASIIDLIREDQMYFLFCQPAFDLEDFGPYCCFYH